MNPGIFYFYYYTPNHPPCNVGFLKLSQHFHSCSLDVHIRNIPTAQGDILKLGAFCVKEQTFLAVFLSEISARTNAVFAKFNISESDLPRPHALSETGGFFLQLADGSVIAAADSGIKFDPGLLRFAETIQEQTDSRATADPEESVPANTETAPAEINSSNKSLTEDSTTETSSSMPQTPAASSESIAVPQPPVVSPKSITAPQMPTVPPENIAAPQTPTVPPENIAAPQPPIVPPENIAAPQTPAAPSGNIAAPPENIRKISRRDLRVLPRRYWNIANNSFLMHGYHNYNHLLLVEKDGYYLIGVPGVYSMRESHAAGLFGFSRFTDEYNQKLSLTDEERNDYGTFGYWCCEIKP